MTPQDFDAVTLYCDSRALFEDAKILRQWCFSIGFVECRDMTEFVHQISQVLDFEGNFGYSPWNGDMNALEDGISQLTRPFALCFRHFDRLHQAQPYTAQTLLEILECQAHYPYPGSGRLLALVQSDDPQLPIAPLEGRVPQWKGLCK